MGFSFTERYLITKMNTLRRLERAFRMRSTFKPSPPIEHGRTLKTKSKLGGGPAPPRFGERVLLLILSREERINIPGDLQEEFACIAAKHGYPYASIWYYKQVGASACPLVLKLVKWGFLVSAWRLISRIL